MIDVISAGTPALGDRSYLATDGQVALVVDPQRDIDWMLAAAATRGVRITHVFETHIHNDYVTGGLALAGALHIPLHDLPARIGEVPPGEIWVHCQSGYRSAIGASLLQAAGRPVVAVDDELARAAAAGLPLVTDDAAGRAA
jgi:rhodanese-related sulfurtransferase